MNELDKLMRIKLEDCRGYPKSENEVNASDAEASSEVINPLPANVVNASDDAAAAEAITEMINPLPANVVVVEDLPHTTVKSKLVPVVREPPTILLSTIVRSPHISTYEVIVPKDFEYGTDILVSCQDNTFYLDTDEHMPIPGDRFQFNIIPDTFKQIIRDIINGPLYDKLEENTLMNDRKIADLTAKLESYRLSNIALREILSDYSLEHPDSTLNFSSVSSSGKACLIPGDNKTPLHNVHV